MGHHNYKNSNNFIHNNIKEIMLKDIIRTNKNQAEANGSGTIYIENGFLKVTP